MSSGLRMRSGAARSGVSSCKPVHTSMRLVSARGKQVVMASTATPGASNTAPQRVVLIGVTGGTGRSAMQGLLSSMPPKASTELLALTRSPQAGPAQALVEQAEGRVQLLRGDLEDGASLEAALCGADAVYCHALSRDGRTADPQELVRARTLAAAARNAGVGRMLYNSSGGRGCGYGISQMEQKHQVEDILGEAVPSFLALQATLFMEELWKDFTRPDILAKGKFTWSVPPDRPIQLLAARDMGLAAGYLLSGRVAVSGKAIELAGDELTPRQMCEAFAEAQGTPVSQNLVSAWPFWFIARDVWRISRFLSERGYQADVGQCHRLFPGMLTFREFLQLSRWSDPSRSYASGITFSTPSAA